MGKVDTHYFKWHPEAVDLEIQLGDDKASLLKRGLITIEILHEEEVFVGTHGTPWYINFEDDKVRSFSYNGDSSFMLDGVELIRASYEGIKPLLDKTFTSLNIKVEEGMMQGGGVDEDKLMVKSTYKPYSLPVFHSLLISVVVSAVFMGVGYNYTFGIIEHLGLHKTY